MLDIPGIVRVLYIYPHLILITTLRVDTIIVPVLQISKSRPKVLHLTSDGYINSRARLRIHAVGRHGHQAHANLYIFL